MGWKLLAGLSAVLAGMAARKLLVKVWTKSTGDDDLLIPRPPARAGRRRLATR